MLQVPRSVDLLLKKSNVIYREPESAPLNSSQSKQDISVQASLVTQEGEKPMSVAERILKELSSKVSVPLLFPLLPIRTRGVS